MDPSIFKAYDIRGIYPDQLDEEAVKEAFGESVAGAEGEAQEALFRNLVDYIDADHYPGS